ncbi:MAG: NAD-dependent epimerase/dehydratase family protein [Nitrospirae bacterium]|nr:NAD-dependent epimerase/dehydratase family protein [Nitrospirota bacterium]
MVVLITGINGFIGRHLSRALLEKGYGVKGTVRSREKIVSLSEATNIYVTEDIGPTTDWSDILDNIDVIIHLAAHVHVMNKTSDNTLMEYRHVNTFGTEHLAVQAAAAGVKRMIYLSTIKVNGEMTNNKSFVEEAQPSPEDFYVL